MGRFYRLDVLGSPAHESVPHHTTHAHLMLGPLTYRKFASKDTNLRSIKRR